MTRLYTRAGDTLDPDDPIFPRAATRVGQKFQATVLSWEEQQVEEMRREAEAGSSRRLIGGEDGLKLDRSDASGAGIRYRGEEA